MSRTMLRSIPRILMVATLVAGPATASAQSSAADLRTGLNQLFQEHIYLAGAATGAALGGRNAEFTAAAGALDANSMAIAKAVGSVYGTDAEAAFLPLWRRTSRWPTRSCEKRRDTCRWSATRLRPRSRNSFPRNLQRVSWINRRGVTTARV
jgi:hypothetical protein